MAWVSSEKFGHLNPIQNTIYNIFSLKYSEESKYLTTSSTVEGICLLTLYRITYQEEFTRDDFFMVIFSE